MIKKVLFTWIGITDLNASRGDSAAGVGPIGQAVTQRTFSHVILLTNFKPEDEKNFVTWLRGKTSAIIEKHHINLTTPTSYDEIYKAAITTINYVQKKLGKKDFQATYHISPGTPAMAAIWILLSKTTHAAEVIESSREKGVKTTILPFDISADYVPDILRPADDEILKLTQGLPPESPEFSAIVHRCKEMKKVIAHARRLALHDVSILIQGESGTGKELFARAIHTSSPRAENCFVAVNCGSIPPDLVESEFFGHKKGAFTGATSDREGFFSVADGGTLFLDEIGELPLSAQVKLLRAIQENKILRVGDSKPHEINIRIIAATNRNLIEDIQSGRFREDLFHRIAVGVLNLPALRERQGDLDLIIDFVLDGINRKFEGIQDWKHKKLSASAKNLMHQHPWPGNVRELHNTLSRAVIWTTTETITAEDMKESLFPVISTNNEHASILNRNIGRGFSLPDLLADVSSHYLQRAIDESKGNKTRMASLLGIPNYQTVSNWLKKYGLE